MYPGVWRQGDWIRFSEVGSCIVTGRSDATLNRGGVRLGTGEFYAVIEEIPRGRRQPRRASRGRTTGGAGELLLFVVLADGIELDDDLTDVDRTIVALTALPAARPRPDRGGARRSRGR